MACQQFVFVYIQFCKVDTSLGIDVKGAAPVLLPVWHINCLPSKFPPDNCQLSTLWFSMEIKP